MNDTKNVTVLGLGAMGSALAGALLDAGHPTTVWNRSPEKAEPLTARGAVAAGSAAEAIAASPLVVACLLDDRSVYEVLKGTPPSGRTLVNLTTNTPKQATAMAEWAARQGSVFLDGGIMATPPMIGKPGAFVLYSGSRAAFDAHTTVLDAFGESRFVGERPGRAALHDLALLSGMYGMFAGALQAFALVRSEGIGVADFAATLTPMIQDMLGLLRATAEQIDKRDYVVDSGSSLAMQAAVFPRMFEAAADQGVSAELLAPLHVLMERRVAAGHGDEELAGLVEELQR